MSLVAKFIARVTASKGKAQKGDNYQSDYSSIYDV